MFAARVWQSDLWVAGMGLVDFTNPAAKASMKAIVLGWTLEFVQNSTLFSWSQPPTALTARRSAPR